MAWKQGLWPEWVEKPAGKAKAICGMRCPTHSPRYEAGRHCMLLTQLGQKRSKTSEVLTGVFETSGIAGIRRHGLDVKNGPDRVKTQNSKFALENCSIGGS